MSSIAEYERERTARASAIYGRLSSIRGVSCTFPTRHWPGADIPRFVPLDPAGNVCMDRSKMWRYALTAPYCEGGRVPIFDRRSLPPYESVNRDWDEIAAGLNHVGRPSGDGAFLRPIGRWTYDLVNMSGGQRILDAAHAVHHMRELASDCPESFLECLAELMFAYRYNLTFWCPTADDVRNRFSDSYSRAKSWFDDVGLKIAVSTNIRKPWMTVDAVGPRGLKFGETSIVSLVGVHLEPQPWSTREDNPNESDESWLEMNRWSCMPSVVTICGWLFVDEVLKLPLVGRYGDSGREDARFTAPVTRLDGPSCIDACLCGESAREDREHGVWKVGPFIDEMLPRIEGCVPPFPCRDCFRLNMAAEGAPTRPMHARPEKSPRGSRKGEAELEWEAYDAKVDKIVRVVEKACAFYDIRFRGGGKARSRRKAAWRRIKSVCEKIANAQKRVTRMCSKGFYAKAQAESEKIESMLDEVVKTIGGTNA